MLAALVEKKDQLQRDFRPLWFECWKNALRYRAARDLCRRARRDGEQKKADHFSDLCKNYYAVANDLYIKLSAIHEDFYQVYLAIFRLMKSDCPGASYQWDIMEGEFSTIDHCICRLHPFFY
jgi:hypothetical protein